MQIKGLHKNIYRLYHYARTQECLETYRQALAPAVSLWETLKTAGNEAGLCAQVSGISRATYYRRKKALEALNKGITPPSKRPHRVNTPRWGEAARQQVLRLRRENPTYGKAKIAVILRRDEGIILSQSTVGRILRSLMDRGLITKSLSAPRARKKRRFTGHAKPWRYGKRPTQPGELVQIDHMSVSKNQLGVKHFQAWDPGSKYMHANVYTNAKSRTAKRFLEEYIAAAPYVVRSLQVDGGSEFMNEFEHACQELGIRLYVLPPKRPQYNGGVERGNRTMREEFYARKDLLANSITELRQELDQALKKYNTYRPHFSLKGLTPMEYLQNVHPETSYLSHII